MFSVVGNNWVWTIKLFGRVYLFTFIENIQKNCYQIYKTDIDRDFEIIGSEVVREFRHEYECIVFIDNIYRGYDLSGDKIKSWRQIYE